MALNKGKPFQAHQADLNPREPLHAPKELSPMHGDTVQTSAFAAPVTGI